jgi:hypothetical protein
MASVEKAGYGHPGAFAEIRRLALIRFGVQVSRFASIHDTYHLSPTMFIRRAG